MRQARGRGPVFGQDVGTSFNFREAVVRTERHMQRVDTDTTEQLQMACLCVETRGAAGRASPPPEAPTSVLDSRRSALGAPIHRTPLKASRTR